MWDDTANTGSLTVENLYPADRHVVSILRMPRKGQAYGDVGSCILSIMGANRKIAKVCILTGQYHFLARSIAHHTRLDMISKTLRDLFVDFRFGSFQPHNYSAPCRV